MNCALGRWRLTSSFSQRDDRAHYALGVELVWGPAGVSIGVGLVWWIAVLALCREHGRFVFRSAAELCRDARRREMGVYRPEVSVFSIQTDADFAAGFVSTSTPPEAWSDPPEQEWRGAPAGQPDPPEDLARWCEECGEHAAVDGTGRCAACNGKGR